MTDSLPSTHAVLDRPIEPISLELGRQKVRDSARESEKMTHFVIAEKSQALNMPSRYHEGMARQHRGYVINSSKFAIASVLGRTDTGMVEGALLSVLRM